MLFGSTTRRFTSAAIAAAALTLGGAVLSGTAAAAPAAGIQGSVTNAVLSCYVDTYALDQLRPNRCAAAWRPGAANNPTVAYFEVTGLTAGSYSFAWTNLETGAAVCGNTRACTRPIATETRGDGLVSLSVRVTDLATGAAKTVSAQATYVDGWT